MKQDFSVLNPDPTLHDGLAIYSLGAGPPALLMPYPHGFPTVSTAGSPLAQLILELGRRAITFDPPGAFRSVRPAQVSLAEMLEGAEETRQALEVEEPFVLVGHSMGGLCALVYALAQQERAHPERVSKLVLIGSVSGGPSTARGKGMPWGMRRSDPDFWRFLLWGLRLQSRFGSLAVHKRLLRLLWKHSYADKSLIPPLEITAEDHRLPAPARDRWPMVARRLDYSQRLMEVRAETLVCVGRFDPQAPVACSQELAQGIPGARLVIFEGSGHYPFIEERDKFKEVLSEFLDG